jgi:preprotein translocase subunit SecA
LPPPAPRPMRELRDEPQAAWANGDGAGTGAALADRVAVGNPWAKTPRNAACPCGSGKKYKHCHGKL